MSLIFLSQRFSLCLGFEEVYDVTALFRMEFGGKQNPVLPIQVGLNMCHKHYHRVFMVILHFLYAEWLNYNKGWITPFRFRSDSAYLWEILYSGKSISLQWIPVVNVAHWTLILLFQVKDCWPNMHHAADPGEPSKMKSSFFFSFLVLFHRWFL